MDRRSFLTTTAVAGSGVAAGFTPTDLRAASAPTRRDTRGRALRVLILGGTNLTGPHNVRYLVERGHAVTIFTRGRREPGLFQDSFRDVEQLVGDRADDLTALEGRTWDVVIDSSGNDESWVRDTVDLLADAVDRYMFVSSTGVFYPYLTTEIDETVEPLLVDESDGEDGAARYGVMKAKAENEVRRVFGDRGIIIRPGYIVGPLDSTHRGTYWPKRLRAGGDVLVPGNRQDQVQQIDVRDLTEFMVHCIENGTNGTFNVTGPAASPTTLEEFVYGVRAAFPSTPDNAVRWHWVEDLDFLEEQEVYFAIPWIMPRGNNMGSQRIDVSKAQAAGLTYRSIATTAQDTMTWFDSLPEETRAEARMSIPEEKERAVLEAWANRS